MESFAPNLRLAEHFSRLSEENRKKKNLSPDAGGHNLAHFRMMSRVICRAHESLCESLTRECTAVVFGAKECADVPLERMVRKGFVYLVDVDLESLRVAGRKIDDPSLKDRASIVLMDASLFENALIEEAQRRLRLHPKDMDRAFQSVVAMNRRAGEGDSGLFTDKRLPIEKNSVDFVVSSMTLSQFMVGYIQLLVKMFLEHYGSKRTREYFLSESIDELQHSTSALARRATAKHMSELGRIAKPGGVVILSDHTLHGRCVLVNEEEVEVDVPSLIPYSKNLQEDKTLRCKENPKQPLPAALRVDRNEPDTEFFVEGTDSLKGILERDGGMTVLEEERWWWVTERARGAKEGSSEWNLSYVEAFILAS